MCATASTCGSSATSATLGRTITIMSLPQAIADYWARFNSEVGGVESTRLYEHFYFGDNERLANDLAELVLVGTKRATANLVWSFEAAKQRVRVPGDLRIVTDWNGKPMCAIETTKVEIVPFGEVTDEFAAIEGEGDGTLKYWVWGHTNYFKRECTRLNQDFSKDMLVACEQFKVVFPSSKGAA